MQKIKNPIIPGFYPDPSICRVGEDFYLACSSFEMFPGVPIFHSRDLVHWEQLGSALTLENGFHMEKNSMVGGIMAPTLRYNDGTFYLIVANFADGGNCLLTAKNPAGPWSAPYRMDDVPGIDASLFFDHDGSCYVMGTGNVWDNGAGQMERGIWLAPYDMEKRRMAGEPVCIFNSALRGGAAPEAPHLYHIGNYYYLMIAEGGTEHYHAVMIARSRDIFGFYEGCRANPVMSHRHLGFSAPILNVGHADLVELSDGSWYAVMLGSRLIDGVGKNLGRETFICPVIWEREWPIFSPQTGKIEEEYDAPALPQVEFEKLPERIVFGENPEKTAADPRWVTWGTPYENWYEAKDGKLYLSCIPKRLDGEIFPMNFEEERKKDRYAAFVAQRQCAIHETFTTKLTFVAKKDEAAGLALVQAMNHQLHLVRSCRDGRQLLQAVLITEDYDVPPYFPGFSSTTNRMVLAETFWEDEEIVLQMEMEGERFFCRYGKTEDDLTLLCEADGRLINTEQVGCMSGTLVGMYATGNGSVSENAAAFSFYSATSK